MVAWLYSINLAIPAALQELGNQLGTLMEYGECFTVPLSPTGSEPITHYGCHTVAKQEFIDIIQHSMTTLELPPQLVGVEIPQSVLEMFFANLSIEIDANDGNPPIHKWNAWLSGLGLQVVTEDDA